MRQVLLLTLSLLLIASFWGCDETTSGGNHSSNDTNDTSTSKSALDSPLQRNWVSVDYIEETYESDTLTNRKTTPYDPQSDNYSSAYIATFHETVNTDYENNSSLTNNAYPSQNYRLISDSLFYVGESSKSLWGTTTITGDTLTITERKGTEPDYYSLVSVFLRYTGEIPPASWQ